MALTDEFPVNKPVTIGHTNDFVYGNYTPNATVSITPNSFSGVNISRSNPRSRDGKYRSGGNWTMWKEENTHSLSTSLDVIRYHYDVPAYQGQFCSQGHIIWFDAPDFRDTASQMTKIQARGAEAWKLLKPTKPDFSLATSIMELKDFPRMAKDALNGIRTKVASKNKERLSKGKSELSKAGQYYLAIQFGYLPLLKDIQNYVKAQKGAQKRLSQLMRDAGRPVRRKATMKDGESFGNGESLTFRLGYDGNYGSTFLRPILVTQCYKFANDCGQTTRYDLSSETWAEGSFQYALPPGPRDVVWKKKMLKRIMGQRVTPDTLYQLMPWSWLIDYFTSLGDLVDNLSAGVEDNVYANYAYIMNTRTMRFHSTSSQRNTVDQEGASVLLTASLLTLRTTKVRSIASPFGWGLKQTDLNLKQQAILAALGMSRLP